MANRYYAHFTRTHYREGFSLRRKAYRTPKSEVIPFDADSLIDAIKIAESTLLQYQTLDWVVDEPTYLKRKMAEQEVRGK